MIRLIKRYGSRKLYDTEESRYVSLDELASWIRRGQEIRVIDNKSSEDVTAQTLTPEHTATLRSDAIRVRIMTYGWESWRGRLYLP